MSLSSWIEIVCTFECNLLNKFEQKTNFSVENLTSFGKYLQSNLYVVCRHAILIARTRTRPNFFAKIYGKPFISPKVLEVNHVEVDEENINDSVLIKRYWLNRLTEKLVILELNWGPNISKINQCSKNLIMMTCVSHRSVLLKSWISSTGFRTVLTVPDS